MIKGKIKSGEYYDSVSLMIVSREINKLTGVIDSSIVMGTKENISILKVAGLFIEEFSTATETDLLISIKTQNEKDCENAFAALDDIFSKMRKKSDTGEEYKPKSINSALKNMKDANLCLISIAGKYAANEAWKALYNNLHVMIFSDNVSLEDEIELKKYGKEHGLLVMGPDCGTAIINGVPLAFANVVNKGNIGIVGASGTGMQEVTSIISNFGAGVSQAIGTGGRDVKKDVGGITFIEALKALNNDENTQIICLVSKPPHDDVLLKICDEIKNISKPVVAIFIGGKNQIIEKSGAIAAQTLEEAAIFAASLAKGIDIDLSKKNLELRNNELKQTAGIIASKIKGKYIRGLFSGGTLCDETQLILKNYLGNCYSNTPLNEEFLLKDVWKSKENTIIDLGDDEFTSGRPHPMIDFTLRNNRIISEAKDQDVAIILLDLVLGYGSNLNPDKELIPVLKQAKEIAPNIVFICSITGTDKDPQFRSKIKQQLENLGVMVMDTNAAASIFCGEIISCLKNNSCSN